MQNESLTGPTMDGVDRDAKSTLPQSQPERYVLKLYVTGHTVRSIRAIAALRRICEEHLQGRFELEVIDMYQKPALAENEQVIVAPMLIKQLPLPLRRLVGDISNEEKVLVGLDLKKAAD